MSTHFLAWIVPWYPKYAFSSFSCWKLVSMPSGCSVIHIPLKCNSIKEADENEASGLGQILSTGINQRLLIDEALKLLIGWILCKNVAARKLPLAFFQLSCGGSESKSF
ncbi:hypothetical protein OIU76_006429 [Salix suchowensis]|nr:hypothetical protein OIU76_006429 [Salix suchowensis]